MYRSSTRTSHAGSIIKRGVCIPMGACFQRRNVDISGSFSFVAKGAGKRESVVSVCMCLCVHVSVSVCVCVAGFAEAEGRSVPNRSHASQLGTYVCYGCAGCCTQADYT